MGPDLWVVVSLTESNTLLKLKISGTRVCMELVGKLKTSITVPPTGLQILEKPTYVSEGKSRVVTCQVFSDDDDDQDVAKPGPVVLILWNLMIILIIRSHVYEIDDDA